jgi:hypothetical protein
MIWYDKYGEYWEYIIMGKIEKSKVLFREVYVVFY